MSDRPTFHCVDDGVPSETIELLRAACADRAVGFEVVRADEFDFSSATPLPAGGLLYRPAVSPAAMRVEQALWGDGVVTFYRTSAAMVWQPPSALLHLERSGVPVPRHVPFATPRRRLLRRYVERLGGFPVVLKVPGGEGGVGVIRADSFASLFSMMDVLHGSGRTVVLMAYIEGAIAWRVIVVGDRAVLAHRCPIEDDDFRSVVPATTDAADATVPSDLEALAVRAAYASGTHFAGVDILEHPSGRRYVLEANFPCYFAQAQAASGVDVAGAMLDCLLAMRHERHASKREMVR